MIRLFLAALMFSLWGITTAVAGEKFTVLLDWFANPNHAPLYVAQELGYFTDAGLDVELIAPADPSDPPKLVAVGQADIGISYQPQLHLQVAEGLPLVRVGTLVATPLNILMVMDDGPIHSIADLKGRKVGFSLSGVEDALLRIMLARYDLTLEDITLINVNFSMSTPLITGQIDAVIGAYRNFELIQMDVAGESARAFFIEEEGVPVYDELIFIANRDRLGDKRLSAFLGAVEAATSYLINHPDESWKLFIKGRGELDDDLNRRAWHATLPRFALRPAAFDAGRYERFARFLKDQGLIPKALPAEAYGTALR